jgi:hypothetical protein
VFGNSISIVPNTAVQAESGDLDDGYVGPDNAVPGFLGVEFRQQETDDQAWSWLGSINGKLLAARS